MLFVSKLYIYLLYIKKINVMDKDTTLLVKKKKLPTSKTLDVSDAKVIDNEELKNDLKNDVSDLIDNYENEKVDDSYVKNLQDQKIIDLNDVSKKQDGEKITVDFMNESHIMDFTSSESKKSEEKKEDNKSQFEGKNIDDLKAEVKQTEIDSTKNFTVKDFEEIATFLIFLIDTLMSSTLKWWAKDSSETAYSLSEKKKDMLVYQLTLILTKYQARFKIEFVFILTIVLIYVPAFLKAKDKRKENINKVNEVNNYVYETTNSESHENNNNEDIKNEGIKKPKAVKRSRGNPGKS